MTMAEVLDIKQGKVTGVIIPPPDIRAVVDKTAQFVARNGKSFEERILGSSEGKTAKFSFMKISDPYHAYYEHKIREFEEGIQAESGNGSSTNTSSSVTNETQQVAPETQAVPSTSSTTMKASITTPIARFAMNKPTEAPHEFEFCLNPLLSGVTPLDLDIIKLAAQYTAVNGREFLAGLAQREQRNPQFDFLKPTHLLFSYFTSLVDSYGKVLRPSAELKERFITKSNRMKSLEIAVQRWEWTRAEEEKKRRENDEADADRLAAVDWSEFAVVETIDFPETELLETVGMLSLNENDKPVDVNNGDMDIDESSKPKNNTSTHRNLHQLRENRQDVAMEEDDGRTESDIKVISDYVPRIAKSAPSLGTMTMIDPISGKALPVSEMSEHMRVQLLDPKWRIEQQRFQEKQKQTSYAEGSSIADSLSIFARKRGDIFGSDSKSQGPDEKKSKITEDYEENDNYKTENVQIQVPIPPPPPSIAPPPPIPSAQLPFNPTIPPPPPMGMPIFPSPMGMPFMPMPMPMPMMNPIDMNHMNNRIPQQQYQQQLTIVSEEEFVKKYPNPITLYVNVPVEPAFATWNLNGQQVTIKINVTSTIKELKEIISLQLGGMPANKQQIKEINSSIFCKDVETLAKLNIGEGFHLELQLKSRGGKR